MPSTAPMPKQTTTPTGEHRCRGGLAVAAGAQAGGGGSGNAVGQLIAQAVVGLSNKQRLILSLYGLRSRKLPSHSPVHAPACNPRARAPLQHLL